MNTYQYRISTATLVLTAAVLLAIWPLPDTIALRNLMLLCGGIASAALLHSNIYQLKQGNSWPIWVLTSFYVWLVFHLALLAGNFNEQWREFTGDWLRSFLATIMGLALGLLLSDPKRQLSSHLQRIQEPLLICGLAGTIIIFCARYAYEVLRTGQWIHQDFYMIPYLGKTPLVIFGGLFLPIMFVKILSARESKSPAFWYIFAPMGIAATIFSYYFANTKNGIVIFVLLFIYFLFKIVSTGKKNYSQRRFFIAILLSCISLIGFVVKNHIETNPAWSSLIADYKISTEIEQHSNWKDRVSPLPLNQYGIPVNGSTYERVAWGNAGLELLKENPWGYGQIHHSFGALAIQKWGDFHKPDGMNRGATHSGWLDFALGFGLPGLLLVWIPLWVSYIRARKRSDFWSTYTLWAIPVIAISYLTTEVCTDHFIELLFFMTALFSGLTLRNSNGPSDANAD